MFDRIKGFSAALMVIVPIVAYAGSAANAQDNAWRVSKISGDVSVTTSAGQETALTDGAALTPGDNIRTGQNGRVLLMRGQETILISPNSVVGLPAQKRGSLSTTIVHQAGSILLEVEKRNVKHFEVETPYLAAVVKGTQFRVTVDKATSRVDVVRGQVEVTDFKSGQFAMVLPNQVASVSVEGFAGLSLSGSGNLRPVQQGTPRSTSVSPIAPDMARPFAEKTPPVRVAAPLVSPSMSTSGGHSANGGAIWPLSLIMPGRSSGHSRASKYEDITLAVAFACTIGFLVASAVGLQRRRQRKKQNLM
jgi:hypothetical protein